MLKKAQIIALIIVSWVAGIASGVLLWEPVEVEPEPLKYVLPADAIELTPCIPQHGAHQGRVEDHDPEADIQGPTYLLNEKGEVIAIEYHIRLAYLERMGKEVGEQIRKLEAGEITFAELKVAELVAGLDLMGRPVQYATLDLKPHPGHAGFEIEHFDVHAYTISKAEKLRTCLP